MLLAEIADSNNNDRCKTLTEEWPPAKYFHKYFQDKIVERKVQYKWYQVTEELYPSFQVGVDKYHVLHQQKPYDEINAKGNKERSIMRLQCIKPQLYILILKNKYQ